MTNPWAWLAGAVVCLLCVWVLETSMQERRAYGIPVGNAPAVQLLAVVCAAVQIVAAVAWFVTAGAR